jgi:transcriptional regulator with XRE-family HTH domain
MLALVAAVRRIDEARRFADRALREIGEECRRARVAAGIGQAQAGERLGWSRQKAARVEKARSRGVSLRDLQLYASVLGLRLTTRAFPVSSPLRDVGQLSVTRRFLQRVGRVWRVALEVPVPIPGDLRAFDLLLRNPKSSVRIYVEVITRLVDAQAQLRAAHVKWRDGAAADGRLLIVVSGSAVNRRALSGIRDLLSDEFPLDTRRLLGALAVGVDPGDNGIVLV